MPQRTTIRLDEDVHNTLMSIKAKYRSMNMTKAVHLAVRYCRDEDIYNSLLKTPHETKPDPSLSPPEEKEASEGMDEDPDPDGEYSLDGGVRYRPSPEPDEKDRTENVPETQEPDDSGNAGNGSSNGNEKEEESSQTSFRDKVKNKFQ